MRQRRGQSYQKRVSDINQIYDYYVKTGLPNREIWRRYIYPRYAISERTFYNMLSTPPLPKETMIEEGLLFPEFKQEDEQRGAGYFKKDS